MNRVLILLTPLLPLMMAGCEPNLVDDPIPIVPFGDITLDLNLPAYSDIQTTKRYLELNGAGHGVRGIILYRDDDNNYHAFERNCSFQPNDACSTVDVDISGLFMYDACCSSSFNFSGYPTGGPAWRRLREYETNLNSNILVITDEIVP